MSDPSDASAKPLEAVSAIVRRGDRFLLVERGRPPIQGQHAFAGGRVEPGETREQAVLRELREETGLVGRDPVAYAEYDIAPSPDDPAGHRFHLTVFRVTVDDEDEARAEDDAAALGWYTAAQSKDLEMPESVHACIAALDGER
ncbi:NUDIX domain-containing protein [Pararhizobium mangrovi]|uniref:NUDIX domain-containing protein n=1 Tax=Pararhizobium mangrovi TaxID=2590452 RepID=A0A506UFV1_9HYPH|nr:NUDIX domain-containing protein [Pararhizobium mangrovi]TPW32014.1 NUDIX domain-containing protein [Pararhizobium mangrovi]